MSGIGRIAAERERQVSEKGWTTEHDDRHRSGSLAQAAACYAMAEPFYVMRPFAGGMQFSDPWPWADGYDKRKKQANFPNAIPTEGEERIAMLVRAGALIAAEIDRLERAAERQERNAAGG